MSFFINLLSFRQSISYSHATFSLYFLCESVKTSAWTPWNAQKTVGSVFWWHIWYVHRLQPCYNVAYSTLLPLCCTVISWFCLINLICLSFPSKVCLKNPIVSLRILILGRNVPALAVGPFHFMVTMNHSHFALPVAAVEIQRKPVTGAWPT